MTETVLPSGAVPLITGASSLVSAGLVMASGVGAVGSITSCCVPASDTLPAGSVAVTLTGLGQFSLSDNVPSVGVASARFTLQAPSGAATV